MRGRCLCGEVEFEILGELPNLYQCHCSLCRKQSGSVANAATIIDAHQLRWVKGAASVRTWKKDTGFRSDFCITCGSPVPNPLGDMPYYWVPAGLLEDTDGSTITTHYHVSSKARWETRPEKGNIHEELPDLAKVLKELKKGPGT